MNDKGTLITNICRITMNRIALFTNVNKVYHKIDTFLKRQIIYIYKLEFCYSDFSKKAQKEDQNDKDEQIFTIVLATTEMEIIYTAMFQSKLNEY
jgi:hypothetical protein